MTRVKSAWLAKQIREVWWPSKRTDRLQRLGALPPDELAGLHRGPDLPAGLPPQERLRSDADARGHLSGREHLSAELRRQHRHQRGKRSRRLRIRSPDGFVAS